MNGRLQLCFCLWIGIVYSFLVIFKSRIFILPRWKRLLAKFRFHFHFSPFFCKKQKNKRKLEVKLTFLIEAIKSWKTVLLNFDNGGFRVLKETEEMTKNKLFRNAAAAVWLQSSLNENVLLSLAESCLLVLINVFLPSISLRVYVGVIN